MKAFDASSGLMSMGDLLDAAKLTNMKLERAAQYLDSVIFAIDGMIVPEEHPAIREAHAEVVGTLLEPTRIEHINPDDLVFRYSPQKNWCFMGALVLMRIRAANDLVNMFEEGAAPVSDKIKDALYVATEEKKVLKAVGDHVVHNFIGCSFTRDEVDIALGLG